MVIFWMLASGRNPGLTAKAESVVNVSFTTSTTDFPNPERGFYRAIWSTNLDSFTQEDADDAFADGYRLVYALINLERFKNKNALPDGFLNALRNGFGYARAAGIKMITRSVYNYPDSEVNYETAADAPLKRIKGHLSQLKPVLRDNADVIAVVQAGFIGAWGEWHTSSNGLDTDASARASVKNSLMDNIPPSRFVQFRNPRHIQKWVADPPTVDAAIAQNFRFGFHNDCFLSSDDDVGTYSEEKEPRDNERNYTDRLGDVGPFGGETCDSTWSSTAVRRTTCSDILKEGAIYNLSYLNSQYWRPEFHEMWIKNGCMPEVRRRLGYRFALLQASHEDTVSRGGLLTLSLAVSNGGWARLYNARSLQIVLQNVRSDATLRLSTSGADPRRWVPGTSTVRVNATVPSGSPTGNYRVLLALADPEQTLSSDPRYSVRFANDNNSSLNQYWDSSLGGFALGTFIQIK
nr:PREDICTED: uncharacterized protein LOC109032791 [Bemisia tabaci]